MRAVEVDGAPVFVSRSEGGEVCAIASTCAHRGGPLNEGERDGDVVTCPWHGSQFDLCSGEVLRRPAGEPQQRFEAQGTRREDRGTLAVAAGSRRNPTEGEEAMAYELP